MTGIPARMIWALGVTQIIGYGTLYYSFGTLAPAMAATFGWSEAWLFGLLSASLLVGGLVAPFAGRLADRHGAGQLMGWGSLAATLALVLAALAPSGIVFAAGLVAIEVASAFVLYATAFAALAQASPREAPRRITHLTLIAGFASTLFWPITGALHEMLSWREVYLIYAATNLLVCVPIHFWLARGQRLRSAGRRDAPATVALLPPERQRGTLLLMLAGFALVGFVSSAVTVHMVPMLSALGAGAAVTAATLLFGPAQVLSRLLNLQFGRGLSQPMLALIGALALPIGLAVLLLGTPWLPGVAAFAILFGLGNGLYSIVSGTLPLVLFGSVGYGRRLGLISAARLIASSAAPFAFSLVAGAATTGIAVAAAAAIGVVAVGIFGLLWWVARAPAGDQASRALTSEA
ncbi:MAG TPA: arsenite efflux MFS transporter ArsK [Devosia sp.]|jgi:predicted MFS family arabinose efflux permease|uniref:arsenite efflux MFS transporter ArsK n=1 Tax=Devosia sp. TaxID=1871048 RepID=UPI002DDD4D5E|nr:arsenite efflux MFS transporter ArsK [Devosia sp.]HEV2513821.1 arsenite efflux MFS transporter ArsK [Devosia sp.]